MRNSTVNRTTGETSVRIDLKIDGTGKNNIETGIGFLNHMLELFAFHGKFDLEIKANGDLQVDTHHIVEDIGLCLGRAFREALGTKPEITRYGFSYVPMDDALTRSVIDLSGRPYLVFEIELPFGMIGDLEIECIKEFFRGFVNEVRANVHIENFYGENIHHIIESVYKSFAMALNIASGLDNKGIPSTKGVI